MKTKVFDFNCFVESVKNSSLQFFEQVHQLFYQNRQSWWAVAKTQLSTELVSVRF